MNQPSLAIEHILQVVEKLPLPRHYWVAYSGGMDSTALLSMLSQHRDKLKAELVAVHVNHQLSANADHWERHCRAFCQEREIRCEVVSINVRDGREGSLEAWARELRYAVLETFMQQDDILMTAHHRDDLAETVIQQLLRGGGPEGLSAMPESRRFGPGWLVRPLLAYDRQQIEDYVRSSQLAWVEDESNTDQGIDRNFIRNKVMPCVKERWPSAVDILWRVSRLQADAVEIQHEMAGQDLTRARGNSGAKLRLSAVAKLSWPRQRNLLRYWIRKNGQRVPAMSVIDKIINELMYARPDGTPCIRWADAQIRRYRDDIYIMPFSAFEPPAAGATYLWSLEKPMVIPGGRLEAGLTTGGGIRKDLLQDDTVEVRFRSGGESIRPAGRRETHELKKLFQEAAVPPWERDIIPLLYVGNELAAVAGHWIADKFCASGDVAGWEIFFVNARSGA